MHTHNWIIKEERSHFSATIRTYICECGEEKESYQIWGLQEVDLDKGEGKNYDSVS